MARHVFLLSWTSEVRTGGVEPPQHEAAGLQPVELTDALRPQGGVTDRNRTGTARLTTSGARRLHHGHHESGDDRIRTGNLSPDKRALCAAELRPHEVARVGFEPTISSS